MPTLNDRQYQELVHRAALRKHPMICIDDFKDKSDRTLTLGSDMRSDHVPSWRHVYIATGRLHIHSYTIDKNEKVTTISEISGEYIYARDTTPSNRSLPSTTDYEFARLMENLHQPLSFYTMGGNGDSDIVFKDGYYGEVFDLKSFRF